MFLASAASDYVNGHTWPSTGAGWRVDPLCDKELHRHLFRLLYKNPILYELTVSWVLS